MGEIRANWCSILIVFILNFVYEKAKAIQSDPVIIRCGSDRYTSSFTQYPLCSASRRWLRLFLQQSNSQIFLNVRKSFPQIGKKLLSQPQRYWGSSSFSFLVKEKKKQYYIICMKISTGNFVTFHTALDELPTVYCFLTIWCISDRNCWNRWCRLTHKQVKMLFRIYIVSLKYSQQSRQTTKPK